MKKLLATVTALLAVAFFVAPTAQANTQVDTIVNQEMATNSLVGVSVAITGPNATYTKSYGSSTTVQYPSPFLPSNFTPMVPENRFRIASATKMFTAHAVLRQIDAGNLSLSDTLEQFVPGIANGNQITVEQLLSHRSGVAEYSTDAEAIAYLLSLPDWPFTSTNAVNIIKRSIPQFAPGTQYGYSNSNYVLLGLILEDLTGKPVNQVITDDIIVPLGLTNTSFPTTKVLPAPYSHGYILFGPFYNDYTAINVGVPGAAGAIISTVGDLAQYVNHVRSGALLSPATAALWHSSFLPATADFDYGFGLVRMGSWIGHDGNIPGFGTATFYEVNTGATITVMTNMTSVAPTTIFKRIAAVLYPGTI